VKYLGSLSGKSQGLLFRICVSARSFGDEVMIEGAGYWTNETEKPRFSNAYMLVWEILDCIAHISSAQRRGADPLDQLPTRVGGRMDKMSCVDSPGLDLHGGDHFNTIIIALCIRSRCTICPAVTHIDTSLAERPGRVCMMNAYLGTLAFHGNIPYTGHRTYHPAARSLSLLWFLRGSYRNLVMYPSP